MGLDAVIGGANSVLKTLLTGGGLARVHEDASEAIQQVPATMIVPHKGTLEWPRKPNQRMTTHDLTLTLVVSRGGDLASADKALKPWVDKIVALFDQNITLGGTTFNAGVVDYDYGHVEYAGTLYLGITFTLRAVEIATVNYHG
ncbi:hypothetical protein [Alicyclobacillus sp. ALC3]|uniref:hypothetical protein n=1 Tax=Alicyclobacillus sp. ALC3 TaxID=2796143 RepID=UPI002379E4D3|nr:hypothetical protein [Alicyclobacillus sp. ALC3]WDL97802.1 hypothetical protein JC200_03465 [Alicyclobacillus sp. ALC3]